MILVFAVCMQDFETVLWGVLIKDWPFHLSNLIYSNENNSEDSTSTQEELPDDLYKQVTSLLLLVRSSSSKSPEAYALFMDELSSVVAHGKLVSKVEVGKN